MHCNSGAASKHLSRVGVQDVEVWSAVKHSDSGFEWFWAQTEFRHVELMSMMSWYTIASQDSALTAKVEW